MASSVVYIAPLGLDDLGKWYPLMHPLVKTHGWERVWNAGMKAIGIPPTWIQETASAVKVLEELERQDKEGNS